MCRLVAGRLVNLGVDRTGDALTDGLYRYVSLQDTAGSVPASSEAAAFAVGFIAHLGWLDHLFDSHARNAASVRDSAAAAVSSASSGSSAGIGTGREMAVILAAADHVDGRLIWPSDVPRQSQVGQGFARHLARLFQRHDVKMSPRWPVAEDLVRLAARALPPRLAGDAV
ncbi:MAG: hypothetical protein H7X95_10345 [Deltaproteobacteria bacterium]|nr:hypothetical protein [Deltaproteobacteria bacterium]